MSSFFFCAFLKWKFFLCIDLKLKISSPDAIYPKKMWCSTSILNEIFLRQRQEAEKERVRVRIGKFMPIFFLFPFQLITKITTTKTCIIIFALRYWKEHFLEVRRSKQQIGWVCVPIISRWTLAWLINEPDGFHGLGALF